jgi:diaminohydroxyphosphoribosylaminopyrimidine deaminase / 5-amino-6-(5-phosphoribosylamino)uracil reductase
MPVAGWTPADLAFMAQARALARLGAGRTWTNPMVGAVVVSGDEVVASAYHHRLGEAHAETLALAEAGSRARGATLYVSLEPCAHEGRTPPCVEGILAAGIARMVVPAPDPDARVAGQGIETLRARGVEVDAGCDFGPAILDNHGYYHQRLGIPRMVTLKMATSRDGMVARAHGQRDRITGDAAQIDTHRLRAVSDAIVIGIETARIDRPRLDCRLLESGVDKEPAVVVFDTDLSLADDATWPERNCDFIAVCGANADPVRVRAIEARGGRVVRCELENGMVSVRDALEKMAGLGMARVLIEGGPRLLKSFIDAGAWDVLWHYEADVEFGAGGVPMLDAGARDAFESQRGARVDELALGGDVRRRYVNAMSWGRLLGGLAERSSSAAAAGGAAGRRSDVHGHR